MSTGEGAMCDRRIVYIGVRRELVRTSAASHSRRGMNGSNSRGSVNGVKAAATKAAATGVEAATTTMEAATTMETTRRAAVKSATAMEATATTAMEAAAATTMEATATTAMTAAATTTTTMGRVGWIRRQRCRCCDGGNRDEREQRDGFATGSSQHVYTFKRFGHSLARDVNTLRRQ
ncbi:hypothetical protein [Bradyrhizobium jicamae]|uniref:hypothetical protein n=1 Tax=Bradyrhizobium jicamae TaxID=280332 RepID=UPI0024C0D81A|nr:hypothetical protein [Bradyrhizobium jicamae]